VRIVKWKESLLGSWDQRVAAWDARVNVPRRAYPETARLIVDALSGQLDRTNGAIEHMDSKAALVIPGVAAAAGLIGTSVKGAALSNLVVLALLVAICLAAIFSVLFSLVCLGPFYRRSNGAIPLDLTLATGDDPLVARVRLANSLGFAVDRAEEVLIVKGFWLEWAMRLIAVGVLALLVFVILGGLK
jgi:hypothetical protein